MELRKEIVKILEKHKQTLDRNGLGWELNAIVEDDFEELALDLVKTLTLGGVSKAFCECKNEPSCRIQDNRYYCNDCNKELD